MNPSTRRGREQIDYALERPQPRAKAPRGMARRRYVRLVGVQLSTRDVLVVHVLGRLDRSRTRCGMRVTGVRGVEWLEAPEDPRQLCLRCAGCQPKPV